MLRWFAIVLIALAVCFQAVGSVSVKWMCEGKVCSTDPLHCCCTSHDARLRDSRCRHERVTSGRECKCKCKRFVTRNKRVLDQSLHPVAIPHSSPLTLVAVLIANPELNLPVRLPETPLLAKPPPGSWQNAELRQTHLRGPPSPIG